MTITIPDDIAGRLRREVAGLNTTVEEWLTDNLDKRLPLKKNFDTDYMQAGLDAIKTLLKQIPCIDSVATSDFGEPVWWLKFKIDISSTIAWTVVQELGHILNYLSLNDKLPTIFYPVSPPPYMNGGPEEFLSWIIEPTIPYVDTNDIYDFLHDRLPEGYDKEDNWHLDE